MQLVSRTWGVKSFVQTRIEGKTSVTFSKSLLVTSNLMIKGRLHCVKADVLYCFVKPDAGAIVALLQLDKRAQCQHMIIMK